MYIVIIIVIEIEIKLFFDLKHVRIIRAPKNDTEKQVKKCELILPIIRIHRNNQTHF